MRIWPLFFLLAGCATANEPLAPVTVNDSQSISVRVTKMDLLQNTYELAPIVPWVSFSSPTEAVRQALAATAVQVCAPGTVGILDIDRPDYIHVPMTPRGYLHCR